MLKLQGLLDASSRVRNTLCVLCTLGLGAYMALSASVTIGTCYSFFVFSFSFALALGNLTNTVRRAVGGGQEIYSPACCSATAALHGCSGRPFLPRLLCSPKHPPKHSFSISLLQVGDVARAAGAINRAMGTMQQALGTSLAEAESSSDSGGSTGSFLRQQAAADEQAEAAQQRGRRLEGDSWRGDIAFRGVGFSHPGGWSLQDVDFDIPAGQTVALVGPRWVLRCIAMSSLMCVARCAARCCAWVP